MTVNILTETHLVGPTTVTLYNSKHANLQLKQIYFIDDGTAPSTVSIFPI